MRALLKLGKGLLRQGRLVITLAGTSLSITDEVLAQTPLGPTHPGQELWSQVEQNTVQNKRFEEVDRELNAVYRAGLERAPKKEAEHGLRVAQGVDRLARCKRGI
jgi:hypothetical protein